MLLLLDRGGNDGSLKTLGVFWGDLLLLLLVGALGGFRGDELCRLCVEDMSTSDRDGSVLQDDRVEPSWPFTEAAASSALLRGIIGSSSLT